LITGAGTGLGRAYSHHFARLGAKVVVNDLISPDLVVEEIQKSSGIAVGVDGSAEEGEKLINACINSFGRIDVIINNARPDSVAREPSDPRTKSRV